MSQDATMDQELRDLQDILKLQVQLGEQVKRELETKVKSLVEAALSDLSRRAEEQSSSQHRAQLHVIGAA